MWNTCPRARGVFGIVQGVIFQLCEDVSIYIFNKINCVRKCVLVVPHIRLFWSNFWQIRILVFVKKFTIAQKPAVSKVGSGGNLDITNRKHRLEQVVNRSFWATVVNGHGFVLPKIFFVQ